MSLLDAASLSGVLLVAKGDAAPSRQSMFDPGAPDGAGRHRPRDQRARIPLRLDEKRHRRLRLAGAHLGQSAQAVLVAALDHYLDQVMPGLLGGGCRCLEPGATPTARLTPVPRQTP